ncbi:hypothetical protein EI533_12400 [Pseudomonas donghuensis]|uniref:hypothetical protein n=1 Tax=Pseudomonas donghuensis TaxID=1163398 RepID=UPI00215F207A|nr:hypothetical protein [Pseudomonas donghuensis]MBF4208524.1 hypothetical protein [Pseudomonas donghuensis]UVL23049.1 hypothetical protein LOY30_19735 [Pseudomonas donghuensis]
MKEEVISRLDLFESLDVFLKRSGRAYLNYSAKGGRFLYAKILKRNNEIIRRLLLNGYSVLPVEQQIHADNIISHIEIWSAAWDKLASEKKHDNHDEFRFSNDSRFPRDSASALVAYCQSKVGKK